MNEHDALKVLDRRMSEASAELRHAVARAIGDGVSGGASAIGGATAPGDLADVIRLDGPPSTPPSRRRWLLAAAASVIVFAGVVGVIAVAGDDDDDDPPPVTTGDQPFLVPGWLPPGWGPKSAARAAGPQEPPATATVYGSPIAEDPWTGEVITVLRSPDDMAFTDPDAETVSVAGHDATVEGDGESWVIEVSLGENALVVWGRGVARDALFDVAAAAADDLPVEPLLPSRLVKIAEGPIDLSSRLPTAGVSLVYGPDSGRNSVAISQRPGRDSELGLIRLMLLESYEATEISVRGHRAVLLKEGAPNTEGPDIVEWIEPPGLLVTVAADGLADDELDRFVQNLQISTSAEIDELLETYPAPPSTDGGSMIGEVVVAEGDRDGDHWRVTAIEADETLEVNYEDDGGSSGFGIGTAPDEGTGTALVVNTTERFDSRGEAAVIGIADPAITDVVVEAAGQPPLQLELHRHEELSHAVVVGFAPRAYIGGEVVGHDSRGREVAREWLDPPMSPGDDDESTVVLDTAVEESEIETGTVPADTAP